ncbi:hypothetical protein D3C72_2344290 [compost metagenome]
MVADDSSTHSRTCMSSCRLGAASEISETSTAPMPNQSMKNVGRTSSSRISAMPKTSQIHHCISIWVKPSGGGASSLRQQSGNGPLG